MSYDYYERMKFKREAEKTALDGCRDDLSDVDFKIKAERFTYNLSALPFDVCLFSALFLLIFNKFDDLFTPRIHVVKDKLFYKDKCFKCSQISHMICTKFGNVKVYSRGKVIAKAAGVDENSEKLIAWARKCKIIILDRREEL